MKGLKEAMSLLDDKLSAADELLGGLGAVIQAARDMFDHESTEAGVLHRLKSPHDAHRLYHLLTVAKDIIDASPLFGVYSDYLKVENLMTQTFGQAATGGQA